MNKIKIAIQGVAGSFHEQATCTYFNSNDLNIIYCDTFDQLFKLVSEKNHLGVVAIENTVAGSILPNYRSLQENNFNIIGETYMRIEQHLMTLPGQNIEQIKEIWSHPMALRQCQSFLNNHPNIKSVEKEDTAKSAAIIRENQQTNTAAIASEMAAEIYNLEIIERGIETNQKNFTRFLIISSDQEIIKTNANKASICFTIDHSTGSLAKVLTFLSERNLNLTKIQSNPRLGKEWEYFFYVDLLFNDMDTYLRSMDELKPMVSELVLLGTYKDGIKNKL
ncbi:MAG: prephenate dehydratase [Flavobacteriales bacterium]|nr:prephenate dehydratase [Flavobacteriales bacterium]